MSETDRYADLGLRERKKAITRDRIVAVAEQLFEDKGFDQVSVAEIADAANVSVKTLFVYFRSKDDLLFTDTSLIEALSSAIRNRPQETSAREAFVAELEASLTAGRQDGIAVFRHGFGQSEGLRNGLLRMWADWEDKITSAIAESRPSGVATPDDRYEAIQLVGLLRTLVSDEAAASANAPGADTASWLRHHGAPAS
jgi:AcrR family transcriptional regulator